MSRYRIVENHMSLYVGFGNVGRHSTKFCTVCLELSSVSCIEVSTVLPAKSDSDFMFCLQSYQGLIIDRSLVY